MFPHNVRNICSVSVRNAIGVLTRLALHLNIALGRMDILITLIVCIHEHGISFYLFVSVQFLLSMFYIFQCAGLSRPWLNLFLVIFLEAIVTEIVF